MITWRAGGASTSAQMAKVRRPAPSLASERAIGVTSKGRATVSCFRSPSGPVRSSRLGVPGEQLVEQPGGDLLVFLHRRTFRERNDRPTRATGRTPIGTAHAIVEDAQQLAEKASGKTEAQKIVRERVSDRREADLAVGPGLNQLVGGYAGIDALRDLVDPGAQLAGAALKTSAQPLVFFPSLRVHLRVLGKPSANDVRGTC